jgi:hypothetical protein
MKHLRKYNESTNYELDHEYIKNCFIEFIDKGVDLETEFDDDYEDGDGIVNLYDDVIDVKSFIKISIEGPILKDVTIESYVSHSKELVEFYLDIENSINKVRLKYTEIKYEFNTDIDENQYEVIFYIPE